MEENWRPVLGYLPVFNLLVRGWICLKVKSDTIKNDGNKNGWERILTALDFSPLPSLPSFRVLG